MDARTFAVFLVLAIHLATGMWRSSQEDRRLGSRRGIHYHTKRHMLSNVNEPKKRQTTQKPREMRKKPSGHLKPLLEDDMENDEVVSVAVGPPPVRPKYDKIHWRQAAKQNNNISNTTNFSGSTNIVKDMLVQLGREFLTHQVSEDFVFGQYVGNAMKNLTSDLRLKMQHDILELVVRYQMMNKGDYKVAENKTEAPLIPTLKDLKGERRVGLNETEDNWPDFTNLAKIVG